MYRLSTQQWICSAVIIVTLKYIVNLSRQSYSKNKKVDLFGGTQGRLGSRVVNVLDSGAEGPGFKSQSWRCRVTILGKLLTPIVSLFTKQRNSPKLVAALLRVAAVTAGRAESNGSLPPGLWLTCRLTAKIQDQLRNPTLGIRVWATFNFLRYHNTQIYLKPVSTELFKQ